MNGQPEPALHAAPGAAGAPAPKPHPASHHTSHRAWRALVHTACAPYRRAGRFAYHFAAGKLSRDPVFAALLRQGLLAPGARVLDIGCGQGVLAALLAACDHPGATAAWPAAWAPAPRGVRYHGLDLMPRDIARAQAALAAAAPQARFEAADMRQAVFPTSDVAVILDVLHYVDHAEQAQVLQRVRDALAPGGRLLLRVGDSQQRLGFAVSQWVDRAVTRVRGHSVPPTWGRTMPQWQALLGELGFEVSTQPMHRGTPFANMLLVAQLPAQSPAQDVV